MKRILVPLALLAGWLPLHASAVCFTVFEGDKIVYRDLASPIDLSMPISDTLPRKYPGGQLVISTEDQMCTFITPITAVNIRAPAEAAAPAAPPPAAAQAEAAAAAAAATATKHPGAAK